MVYPIALEKPDAGGCLKLLLGEARFTKIVEYEKIASSHSQFEQSGRTEIPAVGKGQYA